MQCVHLDCLSRGFNSVHLAVACPTSLLLHSEHYTSKMLPEINYTAWPFQSVMFYMYSVIFLYFIVQANVAICSVFALLFFLAGGCALMDVMPINHLDLN